MFDIQTLLDRLVKVKKQTSRGWTARCPAHDDVEPSLSVAQADDGRVLIHCHAGCPPEDVLAAVGLEFHDLFPDGKVSGWVPGHGFSQRRRDHHSQEHDEFILAVAAGNREKGVELTQADLKLEREAYARQLKRRLAEHGE